MSDSILKFDISAETLSYGRVDSRAAWETIE